MNEKVKDSCSVSRPPIGYFNTRVLENGRENRTVAVAVSVAEQRSPLSIWLFNAYATGEHSVRTCLPCLNDDAEDAVIVEGELDFDAPDDIRVSVCPSSSAASSKPRLP